jgi:hypothetical protein
MTDSFFIKYPQDTPDDGSGDAIRDRIPVRPEAAITLLITTKYQKAFYKVPHNFLCSMSEFQLTNAAEK